ncbi:MAG TPA: hypothetical protein VFJ16_14455 [Longimicrobium sp.]|nr:hypothetical protein [Longimicrobium sp.]
MNASRTPGDAAWSISVAMLALAGAVALALAPAGELRTHPFMALGLLSTFALGGVAAQARWNGRPWRGWPAAVANAVIGLMVLGKVAEAIINGDTHTHALGVPRILRMLIFGALLALSFRPMRVTGERPARRPITSR